MVSRKGSLLEKNLDKLLRLSGFRPEINKILAGYEIDVFLDIDNKKIAFECKQYEKSSLSVRNLIHQWESKKREIRLDIVVLVLYGSEITQKEYQLADKYGIIIWDEHKIEKLLDLAIDKSGVHQEVLNELKLRTDGTTIKGEKTNIFEQIIKEQMQNPLVSKIMFTYTTIPKGVSCCPFKKGGIELMLYGHRNSRHTTYSKKEIESLLNYLRDNNFNYSQNNKDAFDEQELHEKEYNSKIYEGATVLTIGCGQNTKLAAGLIEIIFRDILNIRLDESSVKYEVTETSKISIQDKQKAEDDINNDLDDIAPEKLKTRLDHFMKDTSKDELTISLDGYEGLSMSDSVSIEYKDDQLYLKWSFWGISSREIDGKLDSLREKVRGVGLIEKRKGILKSLMYPRYTELKANEFYIDFNESNLNLHANMGADTELTANLIKTISQEVLKFNGLYQIN